MKRKHKDANYDGVNKAPSHPMGQGEHANMPDKPIIRMVPQTEDFRGGNMNNWEQGVGELSGVDEQRPYC